MDTNQNMSEQISGDEQKSASLKDLVVSKFVSGAESFRTISRSNISMDQCEAAVETVYAMGNLSRTAHCMKAHDGVQYALDEYRFDGAFRGLFMPRLVSLDASKLEAADLRVHEDVDSTILMTPDEFADFWRHLAADVRKNPEYVTVSSETNPVSLTSGIPLLVNGYVHLDSISDAKVIPIPLKEGYVFFEDAYFNWNVDRVVSQVVRNAFDALSARRGGSAPSKG